MLKRRKSLALAPDQRAERLVPVGIGDDVQPAGVARLHVNAHGEADVPHQLLENLLARGERFGRGLRRFGIGSLGGE